MFQAIINALVKWISREAEIATEQAIMDGARRGTENAIQRLTGESLTMTHIVDSERDMGHLEASQEVLPQYTRGDIRKMKRSELLEVIAAESLSVETDQNVPALKSDIIAEMEL